MMGKTRNLRKTLVGPPFRGGAGSRGTWGGSPSQVGKWKDFHPSLQCLIHVLLALGGCWGHRVSGSCLLLLETLAPWYRQADHDRAAR